MSEEERIFTGKLFASEVPELVEKKEKAHRLSQEFNKLYENDVDGRRKILETLLGSIGNDVLMLGPVYFHYGCHTTIEKREKNTGADKKAVPVFS